MVHADGDAHAVPPSRCSSSNPWPTTCKNTSSRVGCRFSSDRSFPPAASTDESTCVSAPSLVRIASTSIESSHSRLRESADLRLSRDGRTGIGEVGDAQAEDGVSLKVPLQHRGSVASEDSPLVDDRHPIAELVRLVHRVRREQDRSVPVLGEPARDESAQRMRRLDVQAEGRLVEEEDLRIRQEPAHEVHLLPHAGREMVDLRARAVGQAHDGEQLLDPRSRDVRVDPVELREHPQVLLDREQPVAGRLAAGHHADVTADALRVGGHIDSRHPSAPRRGGKQCGEDLDRRRLAGPVRSEDAEQLAAGNGKADPVESNDLALLLLRFASLRAKDATQVFRTYSTRIRHHQSSADH